MTGTVPWQAVVVRARELLETRGDVVSEATLGNLADLTAAALGQLPPPEVAAGYCPTVLISWDGLSLEIFEDRIEVYSPTPPGEATSVWYEPHLPGQDFSPGFQAALATACPIRGAPR